MPKKKARRKRKEGEAGIETEISGALKEDKLLIGSRSVFRALKKGGLEAVIRASNLPEGRKKDLEHYMSVSGIGIREFRGNSAKLGETCGKPFNILLVGIKK